MSSHVLLNLLSELGKSDKMRGFAFYYFFTTSLKNLINRSTNVRFYLSHDIKITLNSQFGRENGRFYRLLRNVKIDVIT